MPILRFGLILLIIGCYSQALAKDEYAQVPCAIQISSQASDGKYALSDIVRIARENGMKAVVITERDLMRWEYGLWPLRNVIKKRVEDKSLFK